MISLKLKRVYSNFLKTAPTPAPPRGKNENVISVMYIFLTGIINHKNLNFIILIAYEIE